MLPPALVGSGGRRRPSPADMVARLLDEVPLIDGHNDLPWAIRERFGSRLADVDLKDTARLDPPLATDLNRLRAGGVGGVFWSVWVPTDLDSDEAVRTVLEQIDLVHRMAEATPTARDRAARPTCAGSTPPAASRP
jgi:membrane dipeptidase